ncbi:MAG: hypothetical protein ACYTAN_03740 [Planctomycetota bacterium]|jgi:hypothetical protein
MFAWAVGLAAFVGASVAVVATLRRQSAEIEGLRDELRSVGEAFDEAARQMVGAEVSRGRSILDSIENDDFRMANNLGRLNTLLDQLNGLLHGGRDTETSARHPFAYDEEWQIPYPGPIEFESADELRKFNNLPPISTDDITSADWDGLFKRIQTDNIE